MSGLEQNFIPQTNAKEETPHIPATPQENKVLETIKPYGIYKLATVFRNASGVLEAAGPYANLPAASQIGEQHPKAVTFKYFSDTGWIQWP